MLCSVFKRSGQFWKTWTQPSSKPEELGFLVDNLMLVVLIQEVSLKKAPHKNCLQFKPASEDEYLFDQLVNLLFGEISLWPHIWIYFIIIPNFFLQMWVSWDLPLKFLKWLIHTPLKMSCEVTFYFRFLWFPFEIPDTPSQLPNAPYQIRNTSKIWIRVDWQKLTVDSKSAPFL